MKYKVVRTDIYGCEKLEQLFEAWWIFDSCHQTTCVRYVRKNGYTTELIDTCLEYILRTQ